jgi:hypothetical protein
MTVNSDRYHRLKFLNGVYIPFRVSTPSSELPILFGFKGKEKSLELTLSERKIAIFLSESVNSSDFSLPLKPNRIGNSELGVDTRNGI